MGRDTKANWKVTENDLLKFAVMLMCISGMMQSSMIFDSWSILADGLKYMVPILGVFIVICQIYSIINFKYVLSTLLLSIIIILTCILTKDFSYLLVCIILVLSKNLKIDDFIRISLKVLIVFGVIQLGIWAINCVVDLGYPIYYNQAEKRISFLFNHPNIAAIKIGWGIIMYTWLRWKNLNLKRISICILSTVVLYMTTKSDSCIIILFYLIMVSLRNFKMLQNITVWFSKYCFFVLGIFNILIAQLYQDAGKWTSVVRKLDIFFSRRFAMSYLAIQDNGISIIGQTITKEHGWSDLFNFGNYTIDNLYVYFYVCIGIIYFFLISIGFCMLSKYKDYKAALVVIVFSLFAMTEVHSLYLSNCFTLLLLKCVIFKSKRIE